MWNAPSDMMHVPTGTPYVTKLKSKILFLMDYVQQCRTDEEALNGWRLLCTHGIALVRMALNDGALDKLEEPELWKALAKKVLDNWPPKTAEKTTIKVESGGRYRGNYDHYCVEVNKEDLQLGLDSLNREKYNVINANLMKLWGDCYSIALAVNYFNLDEEIEIPISPQAYTSKSMEQDTSSRRMPKRPSDQTSPS